MVEKLRMPNHVWEHFKNTTSMRVGDRAFQEFQDFIKKYVEYAVLYKQNLEFILCLKNSNLNIIIPCENGIPDTIVGDKYNYQFPISERFYEVLLAYTRDFEFPISNMENEWEYPSKLVIHFDMELGTPDTYKELRLSKREYKGMFRILYTVN